ncbi:hypothetical protein TWF481_005236 [Arthrobotrys musiformis]|uniref:Uncharacterized protein n=1 Tax=Arthrobotrys musiformis TaxID=47236 RepID=A0AAV9WE19_9PEZI
MIEFSLALVVYAVSYLKFFVDPTYIEQKLSGEFQLKQQQQQISGVPPTVELKASEEAALLYLNDLRHQKDANLASGRPCFKPSRFYQPFYACVESTGYETEVQVSAVEVPDPDRAGRLVRDEDVYDDVSEEEDQRRYEEQVARQMMSHHLHDVDASQDIPPPPPPVVVQVIPPPPSSPQALPKVRAPSRAQIPPRVQNQAPPPAARVQVAARPAIDLEPLSLRVTPPTPEEYGYNPAGGFMDDDDDCDDMIMGPQQGRASARTTYPRNARQ